MEPITNFHPVVMWTVLALSVLFIALQFSIGCIFRKTLAEKFGNEFPRKLILATIYALPSAIFLGLLILAILFGFSVVGIPLFMPIILFGEGTTYFSAIAVFGMFSFFAAVPFSTVIFMNYKMNSAQVKFIIKTSVVLFLLFIPGVFGINLLRAYVKYCPETFVCSRNTDDNKILPYNPYIISPKDGEKVKFENGFFVVRGKSIPGKAVFLAAGFTDPEKFRIGKNDPKLSLEGVPADNEGNFEIRIEKEMLPKGEVYVAVFNVSESGVPWAGIYYSSIIKVINK